MDSGSTSKSKKVLAVHLNKCYHGPDIKIVQLYPVCHTVSDVFWEVHAKADPKTLDLVVTCLDHGAIAPEITVDDLAGLGVKAIDFNCTLNEHGKSALRLAEVVKEFQKCILVRYHL